MLRAMAAETAKRSGSRRGPTTVARAYFAALAARDVDAVCELWHPGGRDVFHGMAELVAPAGVRQYFSDLFAAVPDLEMEVIEIAAQKELVAVRWSASGTFDGSAKFEGLTPNGARLTMEGCDVLTVREGKIAENHAYINQAELARQLGAMPPRGSRAETAMLAAVNARVAAQDAIRRLRER
jgi:steroid delta-isomerase-like uncharacterized protein